MMYIVSPLAGLGGSISWRPPAYSLLCMNYFCMDTVMKILVQFPHGFPAVLEMNIIHSIVGFPFSALTLLVG